jgi:hypothetical protein
MKESNFDETRVHGCLPHLVARVTGTRSSSRSAFRPCHPSVGFSRRPIPSSSGRGLRRWPGCLGWRRSTPSRQAVTPASFPLPPQTPRWRSRRHAGPRRAPSAIDRSAPHRSELSLRRALGVWADVNEVVERLLSYLGPKSRARVTGGGRGTRWSRVENTSRLREAVSRMSEDTPSIERSDVRDADTSRIGRNVSYGSDQLARRPRLNAARRGSPRDCLLPRPCSLAPWRNESDEFRCVA